MFRGDEDTVLELPSCFLYWEAILRWHLHGGSPKKWGLWG